jgi:hypothetical protein
MASFIDLQFNKHAWCINIVQEGKVYPLAGSKVGS